MTATPTTCSVCGARTIGWIITVAGGTRQRSVAGRRSRGVRCETCADTRIAELRAAEVAQSGVSR
jgi:hypothetical protein